MTDMYHGWYFVAEMWQTASPQVEGSLVLVVFMFFWVLMAGIERLLRYHSAMWQSRSFLKLVPSLLEPEDSDGVLALAEERKRSHVATVFVGGLREFRSSRGFVGAEWSIEAGKRGARISANVVHQAVEAGIEHVWNNRDHCTTGRFLGPFWDSWRFSGRFNEPCSGFVDDRELDCGSIGVFRNGSARGGSDVVVF